MDFQLSTTNLDDFYEKLNQIGFMHKNTDILHEFEVLKKFGTGYLRHYTFTNNLHISLGNITLNKDLTYSFDMVYKHFEFVYVHTGFLEIYNQHMQQLEKVSAGQFTLFVNQTCSGWSRFPQNVPLNFLAISIEKEFFDSLSRRGLDVTDKLSYLSDHPAVHRPQQVSIDIEALINKIFFCPYDDDSLKKMFFEAIVLEILSEYLFQSTLRAIVPKLPVVLNDNDIERLYMAKQVLAEKMAVPPSIEELSKIVCLNTFKLKLGFKALFNDTIYGYLRRIRMEKTKLLLKNTHLTINDIALQLGYSGGSNLTAVFKAHYGVTPKAYRKSSAIRKKPAIDLTE